MRVSRTAVMTLLLAAGCGMEPVYWGKPLSHWVKQSQSAEPSVRGRAVEALSAIGQPAMSHLILALADSEADIRKQAAIGLGKTELEGGPAVLPLLEAAKDNSTKVRVAVVEALFFVQH